MNTPSHLAPYQNNNSNANTGSNKESTLQDKIIEIWREPPELDFPQCLIDKLDLVELRDDLMDKAETLRNRILARKEEEEKKKLDQELLK